MPGGLAGRTACEGKPLACSWWHCRVVCCLQPESELAAFHAIESVAQNLEYATSSTWRGIPTAILLSLWWEHHDGIIRVLFLRECFRPLDPFKPHCCVKSLNLCNIYPPLSGLQVHEVATSWTGLSGWLTLGHTKASTCQFLLVWFD